MFWIWKLWYCIYNTTIRVFLMKIFKRNFLSEIFGFNFTIKRKRKEFWFSIYGLRFSVLYKFDAPLTLLIKKKRKWERTYLQKKNMWHVLLPSFTCLWFIIDELIIKNNIMFDQKWQLMLKEWNIHSMLDLSFDLHHSFV